MVTWDEIDDLVQDIENREYGFETPSKVANRVVKNFFIRVSKEGMQVACAWCGLERDDPKAVCVCGCPWWVEKYRCSAGV